MAKRDQGNVVPFQAHIREGEGVIIQSNRRLTPQPNGSVTMELGLDMSKAPVPERRYAADIASVIYRDGNVYIMFRQKKLVGNGLRSMVGSVSSQLI